MIIVVYTLMMLSFVALRLFRRASRKGNRPAFYRNDHDTSNARYAINENGYLEEIAGPKVTDGYMGEA